MQRIVMTALLAGALAGLAVFALHQWQTTPMILEAEVFESGMPAHDHGAQQGAGHAHAEAAADDEAWPAPGLERSAYSLLADVLTAIGFGFLLVGAMAISGRHVDWQAGVVWGLCGFAAFFVSPALGAPPELPGMVAAELGERQTWWLATAAAATVAMGLIFFAPGVLWKAVAALLLIAPHAIGAPHPVMEPGNVPAELAAQFAVASLVVNGLFWMALGGFSGYFYDRFGNA
jgi:cobalt transporter subunit CbtA